MRNFRSYNLAVQFYRSAQKLGLKGELRDQLDRASSSIVLNLAEGSARGTVKDRMRFYRIAFGSLRECQSILDLTVERNHPAYIEADSLGAHLFCLVRSATWLAG